MSSSSEDESKRQKLREAVQGVSLQHKQQPSTKRSKPRKSPEAEGSLSSKETQVFLARKLAELLDSRYEVVEKNCGPNPPDGNVSGPPPTDIQDQGQGVKLLQSSLCPISLLAPPPASPPRTHLLTPPPGTHFLNDCSSSEDSDEEEKLRLAVVTSADLQHNMRSS